MRKLVVDARQFELVLEILRFVGSETDEKIAFGAFRKFDFFCTMHSRVHILTVLRENGVNLHEYQLQGPLFQGRLEGAAEALQAVSNVHEHPMIDVRAFFYNPSTRTVDIPVGVEDLISAVVKGRITEEMLKEPAEATVTA